MVTAIRENVKERISDARKVTNSALSKMVQMNFKKTVSR